MQEISCIVLIFLAHHLLSFHYYLQFNGEDVTPKPLTFKVTGAKKEDVKKTIWDIRESSI